MKTTGPPPAFEAEAGSDRPTALPAFDIESFARQQAQSDRPNVSAGSPAPPAPPAPPASTNTPREGGDSDMLELLAKGDAEGALGACEKRLEADPKDAIALHYEPMIRLELEARYAKALGSLLRIPVVAVPLNEVSRLPLDHRSGFVFSLVDGVSNFDTVLAICGMPRFEALRALSKLLRLGAIATL